jgi:hypothetical protein
MKTKALLAVGGLLTGALLLWLPGCEGGGSPDTGGVDSYFADHPLISDPRAPGAPQDVVVTPAIASVSFVGQLVTFEVTGGEGAYHWGAANGNGTVAPRASDTSQAVYTTLTLAGNSVIVYDARGHSAVATVGTGTASALVITPSSATLTTNTQVTSFAVSGGTPPYNWAVLHGANGTLNTTSGASVLYTRTNPGDNALTVSDSAGGSANVVISQP